MASRRERHTCWNHFGFEQDITVYSVGGSNHYVEISSITDGRLILKKTFCGRNARTRAIQFASEYDEVLGPHPENDVEAEFNHILKQSTPMMNALPRFRRQLSPDPKLGG